MVNARLCQAVRSENLLYDGAILGTDRCSWAKRYSRAKAVSRIITRGETKKFAAVQIFARLRSPRFAKYHGAFAQTRGGRVVGSRLSNASYANCYVSIRGSHALTGEELGIRQQLMYLGRGRHHDYVTEADRA